MLTIVLSISPVMFKCLTKLALFVTLIAPQESLRLSSIAKLAVTARTVRSIGTVRTNTRMFSTDEKKETGHQSSAAMPEISAEDQALIDKFREQQSKTPKPSMAENVKTLIDQSLGYGVLSTNSVQFPGFPTGSVVGFQLNDAGMPFFVFSTMSAHTKDVLKDGRVSLTVMAKDFKGAAEGRVVLLGTVKKVFDEELKKKLREQYLLRHKDAYWIDFGYA